MPLLLSWAGPLLVKVLAGLGIGFATYKGVGVLVNAMIATASSYGGGLTGEVAAMAGIMGLDVAFNLIISAWAAVAGIAALKGAASIVKLPSGGGG